MISQKRDEEKKELDRFDSQLATYDSNLNKIKVSFVSSLISCF